MNQPNPVELVERLEVAKQHEDNARRYRIELEEQLVAILGAKTEGSETHTVGDYKVTITGKRSRNVDWRAFALIAEKLNDDFVPVRVKQELDTKALRVLEVEHPEQYRIFSECLTVKPAKTAVTIKRSK